MKTHPDIFPELTHNVLNFRLFKEIIKEFVERDYNFRGENLQKVFLQVADKEINFAYASKENNNPEQLVAHLIMANTSPQRHAGMPGYYFHFLILKAKGDKFFMTNFKNFKIELRSKIVVSIILFCLLTSVSVKDSFSQNKPVKIKENNSGPVKKNDFSAHKKTVEQNKTVERKFEDSPLTRTPENSLTQEESDVVAQMTELKELNSNNGDKIVELQKKLESINGMTVTKQETNPIGSLIPARDYRPEETDNLSSIEVTSDGNNYITGIASQVEQRGATAGKIWIAVALVNGDTGALARPDTIALYYSTTNGNTYNLYAKIAFSGHNKNDFDNIDMEIIESTTGTKYLYIVFGYTTNGGYGQKLIGYTIVSAPTLGYFGSTLFPPGYSINNSYINARITSDNTRYGSNPYVTIVFTQDSLAGANNYILSKVVRILSPYALNPVLTYLPKSIYGVAEGFNDNYVTTDVANYHNGSDSLIFVLSKYPGYEQNIYIYKAFSNSVVYPVNSAVLTPSGDNLEFARVAANGGTNQKNILITYTDDYFNSGDLDQWVLYSYDASSWGMNVLDYTSYNNSRNGDVIGRRDASGSFNVCFKNVYGNMENVSSYSFRDFSLSSSLRSLNTNYANSTAAPKPLFRYVNNDSCLNIWSYFYTLYSTGGCSVSNLYAAIAIEGYYDENTDQQSVYAPVYLLLANQNPPYNILDTGLAYMDYIGMSNVFAFPRALTGDFYLVAKHYNALETWSSVPVHIDQSTPDYYNFTSSDAQAYGNNMVQKGARWCLYSGDINQDGIIDLSDLELVDNDVYNFVSGYSYSSDLNGDYFVDIADYTITDNNAYNFVNTVRP
jgi:hypothetical protein